MLGYFERVQEFFSIAMVKRVAQTDEGGYVQTPVIPASEVGYLVPMRCGHRGKPSRNEERMLDNLIRESGFLDMPERSSEELLHNRSQEREDSSMLLRPEVQ